MRLLHLSDLHFGCEDASAIEATRRFVAANRPDLIVASGDLSLAGLQRELNAAFAWLASLGPPVIATPGNHDVPYFELLGRLYRPFHRYRRAAGRANALAGWNGDNIRVLTINTARGWQMRRNWALGAISERQIAAAEQALRDAPRSALKIVVTHHPLMFPPDSPLRGQTHGGPAAAFRLKEAGADLFLAGHLHTTVEARVAGGALSLCASTLSLRLRGEPPGFLVVERKTKACVQVERYAIAGGQAECTSSDEFMLADFNASPAQHQPV